MNSAGGIAAPGEVQPVAVQPPGHRPVGVAHQQPGHRQLVQRVENERNFTAVAGAGHLVAAPFQHVVEVVEVGFLAGFGARVPASGSRVAGAAGAPKALASAAVGLGNGGGGGFARAGLAAVGAGRLGVAPALLPDHGVKRV